MEAEMDSKAYIDEYIARARRAQREYETFSQERTDEIVMTVAKVVHDNAEYLAEIAVEETGMGNVPDKTAKNKGKARIIWNNLKGKKSKGIIERDEVTGITKIAKPWALPPPSLPAPIPS